MLYCFSEAFQPSFSIEELMLAAAFRFKAEVPGSEEATVEVYPEEQVVKVICGSEERTYSFEELGF